jgi:hypothetical protein
MSIPSHQLRVFDEKADLDTRLKALTRFTLDCEKFSALDEEDRELLLIQRAQMAALSYTLGARIRRFPV